MDNKSHNRPIPYLSLCGAIGFGLSLVVLVVLEMMHRHETTVAAQQTRVAYVLICLLFACWSSIVSLITAWCPIILGGDRRPWLWVVPLVLAWLLFVQLFDWSSLVPQSR